MEFNLKDKKIIQKFFIRKLKNFDPPKWGASHTEERNIEKKKEIEEFMIS